MRVKVKTELLEPALAALAAVVAKRPIAPIGGCIRFRAEHGDTLHLFADDGVQELEIAVPANVKASGRVAIPATPLVGIVRENAAEFVELSADETKCNVSACGAFSLFVVADAERKTSEPVVGAADFSVNALSLGAAIRATLPAVSKETTRYAINGVLCEKDTGRMALIATDGRRLIRAAIPTTGCDEAPKEAGPILPSRAAATLLKMLPAGDAADADAQAKVVFGDGRVSVACENWTLTTLTVVGAFPDWKSVIPAPIEQCAAFDREALLAAVRRAIVMTGPDDRGARLDFDADKLTVRSRIPEQGDARTECAVVKSLREALAIGVNPMFLRDALQSVTFGSVFIEATQPHLPIVLSGGNKDDYVCVVMPVVLFEA